MPSTDSGHWSKYLVESLSDSSGERNVFSEILDTGCSVFQFHVRPQTITSEIWKARTLKWTLTKEDDRHVVHINSFKHWHVNWQWPYLIHLIHQIIHLQMVSFCEHTGGYLSKKRWNACHVDAEGSLPFVSDQRLIPMHDNHETAALICLSMWCCWQYNLFFFPVILQKSLSRAPPERHVWK